MKLGFILLFATMIFSFVLCTVINVAEYILSRKHAREDNQEI